MSSRLDDLYLVDIIESAGMIESALSTFDLQRFQSDEVIQAAVQFRLMVIGEACSRLQPPTLAAMPELPIAQARGLRNRLVHGYFAIDLEIVWEVAHGQVPLLASAAERTLSEMFPDTYQRLLDRRMSG